MCRPILRRTCCLLAAALLVGGCGAGPKSPPGEALPAVPVRIQTVQSKPHIATEEVVGTVRPTLRAAIEAKVSGRLEKMLVVPGQGVKAGDLLAQLDAREVQARLDQALAVREQTASDLKRITALVREKTITQAEFDAAQAKSRVAEATVTEAETMLAYTKVVAPFDGVVTRKYADVGDLASPGKPLLDLEDPRSLRLEADVPEALIGKLSLGDKLRVRIASASSNLDAVVSEISPAADSTTRTFLVKLDLPPTTTLRAGQFGRVAVPLGESTTLRASASAVVRRGQMELVFVVANQQAQLRLVKTGKRFGDELELISGVEAGEQVVVDGASSLVDGQPVTLR